MFKIGDRVKNLNFTAFAEEGEIGTIKEIVNNGQIIVNWDNDVNGWFNIGLNIDDGHGEFKFPADLELVSTTVYNTVYNGGDILYKGSQLLREQENNEIKSLGYQVYSPKDDKDTKGMLDSDVLLFEYQRFAEGTIAEIGQTFGMKTFAKIIRDIITKNYYDMDSEDIVDMIELECNKMINKPVYCHCEDIRRTNIPETGDKRSFYINQYVYGIVRNLCGGFLEWKDIIKNLKNK